MEPLELRGASISEPPERHFASLMEPVELRFASLMADNAAPFCRGLCGYLAARVGLTVRLVDDVAWQAAEQCLYRGEAHLGVVCGLQYINAVDRGARAGVTLLAAPVMRAPRYAGRPIYFSDVV